MESERPKKPQRGKEDKHSGVTPEMSVSKAPKGTRLVYLYILPEFNSAGDYDAFISAIKETPKKKTKKKSKKKSKEEQPKNQYNGFNFTHEDDEKTYEDYDKSYKGLLDLTEKQKVQFKRSFARRGKDLSIELYTLPKTEDELVALRKIFSELDASDILLINAHGNEVCLGISDVSMNATQIADALIHMGLPNPSPLIVLWACNTATLTKDRPKTIIDDLQEILKERGFKFVQVTGVGGYLTTKSNVDSKGSIVTATKRVPKRYPEETPNSPPYTQKTIEREKFLRDACSPATASRLKELADLEGGVNNRQSMGGLLDQKSSFRKTLTRNINEIISQSEKHEEQEKIEEQENILMQSSESPDRMTVQETQKAVRTEVKPAQVDVVQPDIAVESAVPSTQENTEQQTPKRRGRQKKQREQTEVTNTSVQTDVQSDSTSITRLAEETAEQQTPKRRGRSKKQREQTEVTNTSVQTDIGPVVANTTQTTDAPTRISARLKERQERLEAERGNNIASVQNDHNQTETPAPAQITNVRRRPTRMIAPNSRLFTTNGATNSNSVATPNQNVANDTPNQKPKNERTHKMILRSGKKQ